MLKANMVQLVLALVSLAFIVDRVTKFVRREKTQSFFKFLVSVIIWANILVISLFPQVAYSISRALGMGTNLNTLIFAGFIVVFAIIYKLLGVIERLERNITEIVRKEALRDIIHKVK